MEEEKTCVETRHLEVLVLASSFVARAMDELYAFCKRYVQQCIIQKNESEE